MIRPTKNTMDLEKEIQHIFDSGANEIRIKELCEKYAKQDAMEFCAWFVYNGDSKKSLDINYRRFKNCQ